MAFSSLTKDMIIDILTDLNSDDMSKLKFLLMDVAEMRKLMTATNALDLFSSIENVNHLNLYDGYFLAQCFELLGRSDLVSRLGLITNEEAESIHPVNPFRCLLFKLSKGLSSDDVERLTFYCHRVFNLTRREIESINSCLDLFVLLQKRDIISVTNSCQLMRIVQSLMSRGDLVDLVKNYYYPVKVDMTVPPRPRCDMNSNSTDDFPNIPFYTMIANPRGMCVIINNKKFIERKPEEGTDVDQARLEATFKKLGFMVVVYKDVASKDVVGIMRSISIMDHSKFNALVVCVLSYDGYNFLYRKDEKGGITYTRRPVDQGGNCFPIQGAFIFGVDDKPIPIGYLIAFFTESKCKTLAYKPKLFFIQTWQGETLHTGVHHSPIISQKNGNNVDKSIDLDNAHLSENATLQATPSQNAIFDSDSLLGYSTVFGDVSYRSRLQGSLYVKSLTENLDNHAETLDLHALMFKVKHDVSEKNIEEGEQAKKLELTTLTTLRKLLFFDPGNLK